MTSTGETSTHRHRDDRGHFCAESDCRECGLPPCDCGARPPHQDDTECTNQRSLESFAAMTAAARKYGLLPAAKKKVIDA